jgi:hypothetical protein
MIVNKLGEVPFETGCTFYTYCTYSSLVTHLHALIHQRGCRSTAKIPTLSGFFPRIPLEDGQVGCANEEVYCLGGYDQRWGVRSGLACSASSSEW